MKKKLVYIFAFVAGLGFTACEDTLDTEDLSTDNLEYLCSNPTDARKMIDHVYSYFCEDTYTSRMSTNWMQNTDVEIGWIDQENAEKGDRRSVWGINMIEFSDIQNCWDNTLKAIDFANQCIVGIEAADMYKSGNKDMKQLHGEAYCLRAYWYWLFCNFWGDVPFATTPTTKDDMHNDPRTDKNIIYTHLIKDLINVYPEMQTAKDVSVERMNKDFALGMIIRLAMFRAGYSMQADGTMKLCDKSSEEYQVTYTDVNGNSVTATTPADYYQLAINFGKVLESQTTHTLGNNFKAIFDNEINGCNPGDGDVLFEMGFTPNSGGDIGWCHGLSVDGGTRGAGKTYTNLTPYYACSFDKEDQRRDATCANYKWITDNTQAAQDGEGVQPAKWCRMDLSVTNVASKGTGINWPVMRYADALLLMSEAYFQTGDMANAKTYLKKVRNRAFVNSPNKAAKVDGYVDALSTTDFMQAIRNERAWEFGGENIRKFDLVRWNYYSNAVADVIEWTTIVSMNYNQLAYDTSKDSLIQDKTLTITDMGIAPRLYYTYAAGAVVMDNDYNTYIDRSVSPYKEATTLSDDAIKAMGAGATIPGTYYISLTDKFITEIKDDKGNSFTPKRYELSEKLITSFFGVTSNTISAIRTGSPSAIAALRSVVTPYVFPIPKTRIASSGGVLSNDGYAIRNK
ncbi:MAG: RagB/SusD family nutrient uptake outer membrane protein [Prevotella sp.]|nr:RagB/SusD family nutrient uptake outer membrane protein [Prevotella sp.]